MPNKYSSLILTDHSTHSPHDSIFKLAQAIQENENSKVTIVASRGSNKNNGFFKEMNTSELWGREFNDEFHYANIESWFNSSIKVNISDFDVIFLRVDHPISLKFLNWVKTKAKKAIFINEPLGIAKTSTKEYLLKFKGITPWMQLCNSIEEIKQISRNKPIVVKPLKGYGGHGLLKIENNKYFIGNDVVSKNIAEQFLSKELMVNQKVLVNEYLPNVVKGDKRILVVNGKIIGAFLRLPKMGNWVCNLSQGGNVQADILSSEEIEIASILSEDLSQNGIVLFGFDTLMGETKRLLTEINTTNVGGFIQAEKSKNSISLEEVSQILWQYIRMRLQATNHH